MQLCYLARREGQVLPQEGLYREAVNRLFFLCRALEVSQFIGGGFTEHEASEMSALLRLLGLPIEEYDYRDFIYERLKVMKPKAPRRLSPLHGIKL